MTPVFSWRKETYPWKEVVEILSGDYEDHIVCVQPPVNVAHNVTFLVHNEKLKHVDDIKSDDMGVWRCNGAPKLLFEILNHNQGYEYLRKIERSSDDSADSIYSCLKRVFYVNALSKDCRKVIYTLQGNLFQLKVYHFSFIPIFKFISFFPL